MLIVGGGPAGLSAALQARAAAEGRADRRSASPCSRKPREPGAHLLSGAVLDPRALAELVPDFEAKGAPLAAQRSRRSHLFPHAVRQDHISLHAAAAPQSRQLTSSRCSSSANGWRGWSKPEGIDMFSGFAGDRAPDGGGSCRRRADGRPRHRPPRRQRAIPSSPAWTFARRSRFWPTACAAI